LKKEMWGEAVYTATFLLNRSPTITAKITPFEMWEHKRPNLKRLQLFGSAAYAKILGPLKKLDERSKKYIFIGYASSGYRLWDSNKRKIHIAKDVVFGNIIKKEDNVNNENLLSKARIIDDNLTEDLQDINENVEQEEYINNLEDSSEESVYKDVDSEDQERSKNEKKKRRELEDKKK
jgi:hypothetical protein